jgi:hypothetical protein
MGGLTTSAFMWENISLLSYLLDAIRTGTIQLYKSLSGLTTSRNKKNKLPL